MKRKRWSKKQRAEIFAENGGRCYLCGEKIPAGEEYDLDHVLALDLTGPDDPGNLKPAHKGCHREKTAEDIRRIAKARRIRRDLDPETRRVPKKRIPHRKQPWPSRPMNWRKDK